MLLDMRNFDKNKGSSSGCHDTAIIPLSDRSVLAFAIVVLAGMQHPGEKILAEPSGLISSTKRVLTTVPRKLLYVMFCTRRPRGARRWNMVSRCLRDYLRHARRRTLLSLIDHQLRADREAGLREQGEIGQKRVAAQLRRRNHLPCVAQRQER